MAFTIENTEGFTTAELITLNRALDRMVIEYPTIDKNNISDIINNAWFREVTSIQLKRSVRERLGAGIAE